MAAFLLEDGSASVSADLLSLLCLPVVTKYLRSSLFTVNVQYIN